MILLSAQPDHIYFTWQLEVQFLNLIDLGFDLSNYHVLVGVKTGQQVTTAFQQLVQKYPQATIKFIDDSRPNKRYIPSVRPHILAKYFKAKPELKNEDLFYFDSDVIFRELPDFESLLKDNINYLSDTNSYLDTKYIREKGGDELLSAMCSIIGVTTEQIDGLGSNHGGAQYFIKKGITSEFWEKIERDCNSLFAYLLDNTHVYAKKWAEKNGKSPDQYHEIQSWCADMWCVLWNLVKENREVKVVDELKFSWATSTKKQYEECKIFHNAGVTRETADKLFYKGAYINGLPDNLDLSFISTDSASWYYAQYVNKLVSQRKIS